MSTLFDETAAGYDADGFHAAVADRLVAGLGDVPADLVLDVATGTGAAAFAAVRLLHPGRVLAIDISPAMLARAREAAVQADPDGRITWRVAPGVPAPADESIVDVVLCASSLHFLGVTAFADWLRVLRPGGRLAYTLPFGPGFRPSGAFADLVARDLRIPHTEDDAAAPAAEAGFTAVTARPVDLDGRRVFLCHATAP